MGTHYDSFRIYLNAEQSDTLTTGDTSTCRYPFIQNIEVPHMHHFVLKLAYAGIQISWYNVNSYNNVLELTAGATTYTLTVPIGNYTIDELITALNADAGNIYFTAAYVTLTNRVTIENTSGAAFSLSISASSGLLHSIGFANDGSIAYDFAIGETKTGAWCVDMTYLRSVFITCPELSNPCLDSRTMRASNFIIGVVPVICGPNEIIHYTPSDEFYQRLSNTTINTLTIILVDDNNQIINMNNGDYQLVFDLRIVRNDDENPYAVDSSTYTTRWMQNNYRQPNLIGLHDARY